MGAKTISRKIALPDFYGEGKHVYDDELSWRIEMKKEAGSLGSRENFRYHVEEVGLNLSFYYIDGDTFYGIHTERYPIEVKILPRNRSMKYIGFQCPGNTHPDGEVIASFNSEHDIWDNLHIDGKSLEKILERSYIIGLN